MTRYFFHLRDGTDEILDPEGVELAVESVAEAALSAARDCMAADVKTGKLDLRYRIDVEDGAGQIVCRVPFAEAVKVVPAA